MVAFRPPPQKKYQGRQDLYIQYCEILVKGLFNVVDNESDKWAKDEKKDKVSNAEKKNGGQLKKEENENVKENKGLEFNGENIVENQQDDANFFTSAKIVLNKENKNNGKEEEKKNERNDQAENKVEQESDKNKEGEKKVYTEKEKENFKQVREAPTKKFFFSSPATKALPPRAQEASKIFSLKVAEN